MPKDAQGNYYVDPGIAKAVGPRPNRFISALMGFGQGMQGLTPHTPGMDYEAMQRQLGAEEIKGEWDTQHRKDLMSHDRDLQNKAKMEQLRIEAEGMRPYLMNLYNGDQKMVDMALARHAAEKGGVGQSQADYPKHQGEAERALGRLPGERGLGAAQVGEETAAQNMGKSAAELATAQSNAKRPHVDRLAKSAADAENSRNLASGAKAGKEYMGDSGATIFAFGAGLHDMLNQEANSIYQQKVAEGKTPGAAWSAAMEQALHVLRSAAETQHAQGAADITTAGVEPARAKGNADVQAEKNRLEVEQNPETLQHQKDAGAGMLPFNVGLDQLHVNPRSGEGILGPQRPHIIAESFVNGTPSSAVYSRPPAGAINGKPLHLSSPGAEQLQKTTEGASPSPWPSTFPPLPTQPQQPQQEQPVPQWQGAPQGLTPAPQQPQSGPQDGQVFDPAALDQMLKTSQPTKPQASAPIQEPQQFQRPQPTPIPTPDPIGRAMMPGGVDTVDAIHSLGQLQPDSPTMRAMSKVGGVVKSAAASPIEAIIRRILGNQQQGQPAQ